MSKSLLHSQMRIVILGNRNTDTKEKETEAKGNVYYGTSE